MPNSPDQKKKITTEQKLGFSLLLIFGVLAVVMGGLQMRNNIYSPFVFEPNQQKEQDISQLYDEKTRLQKIDTDKDGLNDYEELNFHNTSPYIPDTDSDGIDDKTEIEQGSNPLCPQGETCDQMRPDNQPDETTSTVATPMQEQASPSNVLGNASQQLQTSSTVNNNANNTTESQASSGQIQQIAKDPDALRKLLKQSGQISEEKLKQIDDETLLQTAEKIMKQRGVTSTTTQQ